MSEMVDKWVLWSSGKTLLRGANVFQRTISNKDTQEWCSKLSGDLFKQLHRAGANYVNLSVPGTYNVKPSAVPPRYTQVKAFTDRLHTLIDWATTADLFIVISFRSAPGRSESDIVCEKCGEITRQLFVSEEAQSAFEAMWSEIAQQYKNHPKIVGYDLLVEPHKPHLPDDVQADAADADVFRDRWRKIARRTINRIRSIDKVTPILVNVDDYSSAEALAKWEPLFAEDPKNESRIVTAIHQYQPFAYTHGDAASGSISFDPTFSELRQAFTTIENWMGRHPEFPIAVNEFGLNLSSPSSHLFLKREFELLKSLGLNHAIWLWDDRNGDCYDPKMDVYFDVDDEQLTEFSKVLRNAWNVA